MTNSRNGVNPWKWAFIILVLILTGGLLWILFQFRPIQTGQLNQEMIQANSEFSFNLQLGTEDAETISNHALTYFADENDTEIPLNIVLDDQVNLIGHLTIFNFDIPFELSFNPQAQDNGNLLLEFSEFKLARFSLPVTLAMNQIEDMLDFPDWIAFDSEAEEIAINFTDVVFNGEWMVQVEEMALDQDIIDVKILYTPNES